LAMPNRLKRLYSTTKPPKKKKKEKKKGKTAKTWQNIEFLDCFERPNLLEDIM